MGDKKYIKPEYYYNRELSWLEFDGRCLSEAQDESIPLFERIKFLSITASNLDEFFMVRVASLKDQVHAGYKKKDIAGMTSSEQLEAINDRTHSFMEAQYRTLNDNLLPDLKKNGLRILTSYKQLNDEQANYVDDYFKHNVYPVLTPMAVDSSRPFPLVRNKTLNIAALILDKDKGEENELATVQVPSVLDRVIKLPSSEEGVTDIILLEEIIEKNLDQLFLNYEVKAAFPYRVMRNADFTIDEEEAEDLLVEIEKSLKRRQWGEVIRLEIAADVDKKLLKQLKKELDVMDEDVFRIEGPLDLTFLMKVNSISGFEHLKYEKWIPKQPAMINPDENLFDQIRNNDILMQHPYESFDPVVNFVRLAAKDPDVLAIKQTLYRVSGNSPIIAALALAAENGKQVSVLVELKARFDEENNIIWARKLEQAGCHVIYGLKGLKTHSKITLVVRREEDGIRRYVHLGTGNYNDSTAKLYTDMGLFTSSELIGEDATAVFNMLSGYSEPPQWNKLTCAPIWLRDKFIRLINREKEHALEGKKARIVAKLNSLCDRGIIAALYEASAAGVKIDLIVRGICSLKVGIPDVSENITVRSIVGNFLEHSRIYYFYNEGYEDVYMASADWMPRNLDRRVEIMFPIEDDNLKDYAIHVLDTELKDNVKAHIMQPDGSYIKPDRGDLEAVNSQEIFQEEANQAGVINKKEKPDRVFIPIMGDEGEQ
ncbi:MAG: RNA degradosome polyphosphate kinase [Lachnospiraceae bacterium]|nr:RNA degradosome polyphosphate kinase [Lachnospiraceae bacterium]